MGLPPPYQETAANPPPPPSYFGNAPPPPPGLVVPPTAPAPPRTAVVGPQKMGPGPTGAVCPACNKQIVTRVDYASNTRTHIASAALCVLAGCKIRSVRQLTPSKTPSLPWRTAWTRCRGEGRLYWEHASREPFQTPWASTCSVHHVHVYHFEITDI
ncbi:hypothetical protein EVAR_12013_1 [Eumeta japonica]|uniref:LITAF domain-containing protein n=1 Tax=Eumeta variegata TaxID=151549 RepID=A0A4C1U4Y9_EUMVA|nr:hypothetical protein EVAR_12013_1 [Eumeta japonica]